MELNNFFAYIVISFFTIVSPGAAILLAINNGILYDIKAVLLSTLGNILGLFILSTLAIFAVGSLFSISNIFLIFLKIIGACYLVYLGFKQIFSKDRDFKLKIAQKQPYNSIKIFKKGFLIAITNPKPILFFSAVFPLFLNQNHSIIPQFFIMTFTFMFISFCSLLFYATLSKQLKNKLFNQKRLDIFYKISGSLFILMGIWLLFLEDVKVRN